MGRSPNWQRPIPIRHRRSRDDDDSDYDDGPEAETGEFDSAYEITVMKHFHPLRFPGKTRPELAEARHKYGALAREA